MTIDEATYGKARIRIQEAARILTRSKRNLRDQFPVAYTEFLRAGSSMPTHRMQQLHEEVVKSVQRVKQGCFDEVTDVELRRAAQLIDELNRLFFTADYYGVEPALI